MLTFFLKGMLIGFSIAAPVGPIGVLCIRRSVADGTGTGLAVGMGAATADALYGCVAAFGLTAVRNFLIGGKFWLGLLGGIFLIYLGVRTMVSKPREEAARVEERSLLAAYFSTLVLTLTNPSTILSFIAVFAGTGFGAAGNWISACVLVAGVFAGSALWWVILSSVTGLLRSRMTAGWMRVVNGVSGVILAGFGVWALSRIL